VAPGSPCGGVRSAARLTAPLQQGMMRKPEHERVRINRELQEREQLKMALKNTEYILSESVYRLTVFQRRLDRGARRGRQRSVNQCLSAPYKANAAQRRSQLLRTLQQQTRDLVYFGEQGDSDDSPTDGPKLNEEDEALLKEVAEQKPELRLELEAALESAKRRPSSAVPSMDRRRSCSTPALARAASPSAPAAAGGAVRTEMSNTVISAFLEHLGHTSCPIEPLAPMPLLNGNQNNLGRSDSTGTLDGVGHTRTGRRRPSLVRRSSSLACPVSQGIDTGSRPATGRRNESRPRSPAGTPKQAQREASPANVQRLACGTTPPASCGTSPQAQRHRSFPFEESSRRSSRTKSPGGHSVSSKGSVSSPTAGRSLFQSTSKEEG